MIEIKGSCKPSVCLIPIVSLEAVEYGLKMMKAWAQTKDRPMDRPTVALVNYKHNLAIFCC